MATSKKLVTKQFSVENAKQFISSNNELFVYVAKHTPYTGDDSVAPDSLDSVKESLYDVYDNMIFSKRVSATNMVHMIPKVMWTANTVYDMYDHRDVSLYEKDFYVVTNPFGSEYNVFKCLDNAGGANSTVAPTRVGSNADLQAIITGDNYIWKYMYTISDADWNKFSTSAYVPVTANSTVISAAIPGTIETIKIDDAGRGYNNYILNGVFQSSDIKVGGSTTSYGAPSSASSTTNFYAGCVMRITSGGGVDQYKRINSYETGGTPKIFELDSEFSIAPVAGDSYEVYPYVYVFGDGNETAAEGIAIIDPNTSNSVSRIEMLNIGRGYRNGQAFVGISPLYIQYNSDGGLIQMSSTITSSDNFIAAELSPMISPQGGHGSDPYQELFANKICVFTKFSNTEAGVISTNNDFRQIGIISNPKLTNVDLFFSTATAVGTFRVGETVRQFKNIKLAGNVTVSTTANTITKTDGGKISTTIAIANGGINYDSTSNNSLVITAPEGGGTTATATFINNGSGTITSVTVTNQGTTYENAPTVTVSGGSNAVLTSTLANPEVTFFTDSFVAGDYVLVQTGSNNWINTVSSVPFDYQIVTSSNALFSNTNARVSKLELGATGVVTSVSTGQITLSNVQGIFQEGKKIVGLSTGATGTIRTSNSIFNAIELNDRNPNGFGVMVQLTKLLGTLGADNFRNDESIVQENLVSYFNASGTLHHIEVIAGSGNDLAYITNRKGVFITGNNPVVGENSDGILTNVSAIYPGDFVRDSGKILFRENNIPISRASNKSEIVKIILDF